jgi:CBS domain containing-hemolysin-like protein
VLVFIRILAFCLIINGVFAMSEVAVLLRHTPREGETITRQGFSFEPFDMEGMRMERLLVTRA